MNKEPFNVDVEFDKLIGEVPENAIYRSEDRETCVMCGHPTKKDIAVKNIKAFIHQALEIKDKERREELRGAVEGMKKYGEQSVPNDDYSVGYYDGHVKALSDVLELLKNK